MHNMRDMVYSINTLTEHKAITVDYNIDIADIFCEMTRIVLERQQKLDILNVCGM